MTDANANGRRNDDSIARHAAVATTPSAERGDPAPATKPMLSGPDKFYGGLALCGVTVGMYFYLAHLEASGGSIRLHWILALAYSWLGKWGVTGLMALSSLGITYSGLATMLKGPTPPER